MTKIFLKCNFCFRDRYSVKMDQVDEYSNNNTVTGKDTYDVLEAHSQYFRWNKGEKVLDIGCGPGDVTANIVLPFLPEDCTLVGHHNDIL